MEGFWKERGQEFWSLLWCSFCCCRCCCYCCYTRLAMLCCAVIVKRFAAAATALREMQRKRDKAAQWLEVDRGECHGTPG